MFLAQNKVIRGNYTEMNAAEKYDFGKKCIKILTEQSECKSTKF